MIDDYKFVADATAIDEVVRRFSTFETTCNVLRIAISLGATIAGGAAMSMFEKRHCGNDRSVRPGVWRDIDLWFRNSESLDAFMASVRLQTNVRFKPSFGGCAIDIVVADGGPNLQAITFRTGSPIEIISKFDFKNCAVAFDNDGFVYHRDVPSLMESRVLSLLNNDSPYFLSRVKKYSNKGYTSFDDAIKERIRTIVCTGVEKAAHACASFVQPVDCTLSEYDETYKPAHKAFLKADAAAGEFVRIHQLLVADGKDGIFTDEAFLELAQARERLSERWKRFRCARSEKFKLPYGYGVVEDVDYVESLVASI